MADPLINRRLGRYQIHQEIGRGGMARVYRATDTLLQRQVALKILTPQPGSDPRFAHRFEREAVTAANLRHPAIITIFDVGEADGLHYIAMEYIAGRTLHEALAERGPLGLSLTVAVLQPVVEALDYAHRAGAVHRDVKPHNILLDTDGRVLLTDFGIAIGPQAGNERLTQVGMFMGTPEYLSPEQAQAQPPSGRSDLYSLAIVAWEALTGRVPFEGGAPQLIMAHVYTPPPAISSFDPSLPPELDQFFARALAKRPEERFARAPDLLEALRTMADQNGFPAATRSDVAVLAVPAGSSAGRATVALQVPIPSAAARPRGQESSPPAFPIAEIWGETPGSRPTAPPIPSPAPPAQRVTPAPAGPTAAGGPRVAATTRPVPGRPAPREGVNARAEVEDAYIPPPPPPRRRPRGYEDAPRGGISWSVVAVFFVALLLLALLLSQSLRRGTRAAGNTGGLQSVFVQPTLPVVVEAVATESPAGTSLSAPLAPSPTPVPTAGATQTTLPPVAQTAQPQAASATSGSPVAQSAATSVVTAEPATVPLPTAAPSVTPAPPLPGPTPEGGAAALVFQLGPALNVLDTRQGSGVQISANADSRGPAAISPDGNSILFDAAEAGEQRHIFRFDRAANRVEAWSRGEGDFYQPAWMPDGNRVTFVSTRDGNAEIYLTDVDGGNPERLTTDPAQDEYPSWSPDGSLVIWESRRDEGWQIWTMNQDGQRRPVEPVPGHDDRYPRISPDGTQVVFASNRDRTDDGLEIYVQSLDGGLPRRLTSFETGSALGPQWSPDGRMIVFWSDAEGNQDIYTLRLADGEIKRFGDSPGDERWPVWGR